jgi:putative NADH-flavin reductase
MYKFLKLIGMSLSILFIMPLSAQAADSKTIVVYGASGKIGGLIVDVALERGHKVIGVSRNPANLTNDHGNFSAVTGDVTDPMSIKSTASNADAIIVSVTGAGDGNKPENSLEARSANAMISAYSGDNNAPRVIMIGGATTMFGDAEAMKEHLPFPAPEGTYMHGMLFGHLLALDAYRASSIPWTVVTPPLEIVGWGPKGLTDGDTTMDSYRTSTTEVIKDAEGHSRIYVRDLAKAAVDEIENAKFVGQRFTVGY